MHIFHRVIFCSALSLLISTPLMAQDSAQQLAFLLESTFHSDMQQDGVVVTRRVIRLSDGQAADSPRGVWLYSQTNASADKTSAQQRLLRLIAVDQNTVILKSYTPQDLAEWLDAWDKPEVLQGFGIGDFAPSFDNSCDQRWRRQGKQYWVGTVDPTKCVEQDQAISMHITKLSHVDLRGFSETVTRSSDPRGLGNKLSNTMKMRRIHNSSASLLAYSSPQDWRQPEPENLMLLQFENGEVLFELAPSFAPKHVANIRQLVASGYFDGSHVIRSQDNYVAQWGDARADTEQQRSLGDAKQSIPLEFYRDNDDVDFRAIESRDAYAKQTGFAAHMPVSSDGEVAWMTHCYGMLGVGRGGAADSGNGSSLYMVNGHAPRHLDRNVTLVGRVISGADILSSLPRGTGPLGFYTTEAQYIPITKASMGDRLPAKQLNIEVYRTDTEVFQEYVALRTTRNEAWFLHPSGKIDVCNVAIPTRLRPD